MALCTRGEAHRSRADWRVIPPARPARSAEPSPGARLRCCTGAFPPVGNARAWGSLGWAAAALLVASRGWSAPVLGSYADLAALPGQARAAALEQLAARGVSSVRLPLDWNRVEPKPKLLTWRADDAAVNAARALGLEVVLVLGPCATWAVNPAWQVPAKERACSLPRSPVLWERYVRAAVQHFRGRVRYWQVREHPDARSFRGTRSEYLRLLASAARIVRATDPKAVIVMPESGALDIAEVDRLRTSNLRSAAGVLGLYLPASPDLSDTALAWAVLEHEVLAEWPGTRPRVWVLGGDIRASADLWLEHYLLASAFGVERLYLPSQEASDLSLACRPLVRLGYVGFLRLGPELWALAFSDGPETLVAAWSPAEIVIDPAELAPVRDPAALRQSSVVGGPPGSAVLPDGDPPKVRLGPRPVLLYGLDVSATAQRRPPTRDDVLAARPDSGVSGLPAVSADYARGDEAECGLYNRKLRDRVGGRIAEETRDGRGHLRTRLATGPGTPGPENPWIYFDVDDRWLYLARARTPVAITVECEGSNLGEKALGFNIMYDSTTGYRFTPWQWVAPAPGLHRYQVELRDVSFGDRDGYDFRINVKGSREDLWVTSVTVEKLPEVLAEPHDPSGVRPTREPLPPG